MSLFPIPKGIIERVNKIQRQFLWSGNSDKSLALAPWHLVELPKQLGGLGIGNLLHRNFALLFKWVWRFFAEPTALWRWVITSKFDYPPSFTISDIRELHNGGPWKTICNFITNFPNAQSFLHSRNKSRLGNGNLILFWHEIWIGDAPLKSLFPRLFRIAVNPLASISSLGRWNECKWVWEFQWQRPRRPRDLDELAVLQNLIHNVIPSFENDDSLIWTPHKSGLFSVKSLCLELAKSSNSHNQEWIKTIWKVVVPPHIEVFTWLALLGKINTKWKLASIGIIPPEDIVCAFVNPTRKIITTYYFTALSPLACGLGGYKYGVYPGSSPQACVTPLCNGDLLKKGGFFKKIWFASFFIIVWSIWKERNARIFNNTSLTVAQVQDLILARISWWIQGWGDPFAYSCADIIRNPSCLDWNGSKASLRPPKTVPKPSHMAAPSRVPFKMERGCFISSSSSHVSHRWSVERSQWHLHLYVLKPYSPNRDNSAEVLAIFRALQVSLSSDRIRKPHNIDRIRFM